MKLSPVVREILSFPDETGLASLLRLLEHLQLRHSELSALRLIEQVERVLLTCSKLGYLYLKLLTEGEERTVPLWNFQCPWLGRFVSWDEAERCWTVSAQEQPVEDVLIQLTQGGVRDLQLYYEQARERLNNRKRNLK